MAEAQEQSQGLAAMMKQLLDGFNSLKAGQAETQAALRGIQERTDAVEARIVAAAKPAPPPPPAATGPGAVPITSAPSSSSAMGTAPIPIHTASSSSTNSTSLLGMPAIPLSANSMIDPAMDPFDRAILLCKQMLPLLSGPVVKPEDSGVDQELADGSDNSSSSPVGAMPANCSTVGFSPNVGDAELGISSLQPEDSGVDEERADSSDSTNSTPDGTVPAKCSTLGFSTNVGGAEVRLWPVQSEASDDDQEVAVGCDNATNVSRVEAMDSYRQSGVVSRVSPGPAGAPPPPAMQQFGILKPDKHTPTTYSTVVLNMGSDATRPHGDMKTMQASLVYTPTAAPVSSATMQPQAPDQPRLLLDRPPPWPLWKVLSMFGRIHGTTGMLSVPGRPPDLTWKTTVPLSTMATSSVSPSNMPLGSVESELECPWFLPLPLLACGKAKIQGEVKRLCTSPYTKLPHTSKCPHVQLPETAPSEFTSTIVCDYAVFLAQDIGNATRLRSVVTIGCNDQIDWLLADHWCGLVEVGRPDGVRGALILPLEAFHDEHLSFLVLLKVTTCGSNGSPSFHMGNSTGLFLTGKEASAWGECFYSFVGFYRATHMKFEHQHSWQADRNNPGGTHANSGKWIPMQTTSSWQQMQCHLHMKCSVTPRLSIFTQTSSAGDMGCADFFPTHMMLKVIVHVSRNILPWLSEAGATCELLLPRQPLNVLAFCGDITGCLVMLSIIVPWDPGIVLDCTHLLKTYGTGKIYIREGFSQVISLVIHVWALTHQLSELQCPCETSLQSSCYIATNFWVLEQLLHCTCRPVWNLASLSITLTLVMSVQPRQILLNCLKLPPRFSEPLTMVLRLWEPGGSSPRTKSPQLALRDIQSTLCDCLAHRQCTWAPYEKTLGTHLEALHNYNACIFLGETWLAGVMCKTKDLGLMLEGTIIQELIPQIARKTVLGEYAQYKTVEQQRELLIALRDHNDQVACVDRTSLSLPWDPDVQQLWDPGGFTSTLGLGASRNLRRGDCHGLYPQDGPWWRGLASRPKSAWIATTKGNKLHQEEDEQYRRMNSAFPDPLRLPPESPVSLDPARRLLPSTPESQFPSRIPLPG